MLRDFFAEAMQSPKVGMAIGGAVSSAGAAVKWLDVAKEWISTGSIILGVLLSLCALVAQIVRIRNDRRADKRAEEMHRLRIEAIKNGKN